ncbi:MAG: large conductance mechanosensitive channel protein MscL [Saccharofermentanales bacterium]
MFKEFKAFALKGNVIDLAVGVIIGAAFGKIVSSMVNDLIMPLIGLLTGAKNFGNLFLMLKKAPAGTVITTIEDAKALNIPTLNYGVFISNVVDFVIVAFVIFMMIKMISKLKEAADKRLLKKNGTPEVPAPTTKTCPFCRTTIDIEATKCPACTSVLDVTVIAGQAK